MAARSRAPQEALHELAAQLAAERSVISPHVADPADLEPSLGLLAASGPRAGSAPGDYAVLIEAIREGYLLHYAEPRLVVGADPALALLAGDYLYARGLERLAALGDLDAIRELADLISLVAQLHSGAAAESPNPEDPPGEGARGRAADALWLAAVTSVAAGPTAENESAKLALREGRAATRALWEAALNAAGEAGIVGALEGAAEAIGFRPDFDLRARGRR
jgi:hypothetical protein